MLAQGSKYYPDRHLRFSKLKEMNRFIVDLFKCLRDMILQDGGSI